MSSHALLGPDDSCLAVDAVQVDPLPLFLLFHLLHHRHSILLQQICPVDRTIRQTNSWSSLVEVGVATGLLSRLC